jgi:predicted RNA-binding protein with PIN domain
MAEPTLYLFDGFNIFNAGSFADVRELRDTLASFVATRGARGVLVFDGSGPDERYGPLEVRYAANADALLERLAAEHRRSEEVCLVSSDVAVRGTSGQEVAKVSSREFAATLASVEHREDLPSRVGDRIDAETRERLERLRRSDGQGAD